MFGVEYRAAGCPDRVPDGRFAYDGRDKARTGDDDGMWLVPGHGECRR